MSGLEILAWVLIAVGGEWVVFVGHRRPPRPQPRPPFTQACHVRLQDREG